MSNPLFPVFLKLESLRLLLVGGGNVALEKLTALYENCPDPRVSVVATRINPQVKEFLLARSIPFQERSFRESDLENTRIAVIAVNDKAVSAEIKQYCASRNILTNVADTPGLCDFYLGSVVRKGALKIAISTNGKSPTVAKRVKDILNESFPAEIDDVLNNIERIRGTLSGDFTEKVKQLNEITSILGKKTDTEN
ncbi:precorrin-2 dehydrogenase/sirohydrochlorin ferrochelatase family protein [Hufsiella ginkgonis]|uniref:precorrin-2 dehydrogenase n=1 Tax=Hufsiella ginkgonis TaxID=2695274 RepID=A0A7K1XZ07_9SPHI|nr:bifunctional precorrin-2 dehydrogenase/sirohydrochlorin ferrochelatase [Hufsiella ginkgonis]MXV16057.1 bifunctional precorrin-2 dehydrogenase/sirohydrochlorin ferrochelatase [Hufsiella ginkgonis]